MRQPEHHHAVLQGCGFRGLGIRGPQSALPVSQFPNPRVQFLNPFFLVSESALSVFESVFFGF